MDEQVLIDITYYLLHDVFQWISYFFIISAFLTPKYNRALIVLIPSVIGLFPPVYKLLLGKNTGTFMMIGMLTVVALTAFKEKKRICLFAVAVEQLGIGFMAVVTTSIVYDILGYYPTEVFPYTWVSVIYTVILDILLYCCFGLILLVWNKQLKRRHIKSVGYFWMFPFGQMMFFFACVYRAWQDMGTYILSNNILIIALIISVISDIILYFGLKQNDRVQDMERSMAEMEKQMQAQLEYYNSLTEKFAEIREYRHDINNIVAVAESLLNEDISRSDGEAMLSEIKERAAKTSVPMFCSNPIINTVIWQKQQEAGQLGIEFSAEIDVAESFPFDKIDICSLFANLLDNAIREASSCKNGFVRLFAGRKSGVVFVTAENSSEREIKQGAKPKTTKNDGSFHGSGLDIIEKITAKYGGSFTLSAEKGTAVASAALLPS